MQKEACLASPDCSWCKYQNPEASDCPNKGLPTSRIPEWTQEWDGDDPEARPEDLPSTELPGMWDHSDFTGGQEDSEPDLTVEPENEEQMAEMTIGGLPVSDQKIVIDSGHPDLPLDDPTQGFHELTEQMEKARSATEAVDPELAALEAQTTAAAIRELGRAFGLVWRAFFLGIKFQLVPVATWLDKVMIGSKERYAQWDQRWSGKI